MMAKDAGRSVSVRERCSMAMLCGAQTDAPASEVGLSIGVNRAALPDGSVSSAQACISHLGFLRDFCRATANDLGELPDWELHPLSGWHYCSERKVGVRKWPTDEPCLRSQPVI